MEVEFSRQIFEKHINVKFYENMPIGYRVILCGRTDRHGEANSGFSRFCERVLKYYIL